MNKKVYDTIILGAGAAGLYSGIFAAMHNESVLLLEKRKTPGNKLSITGNGHCNFTHDEIHASDYTTDDVDALILSFSAYSFKDTLRDFMDFGIPSECKNHGFYPLSQDAKSVVSVFLNLLDKYKANLQFDENVRGIERTEDGFLIKTNHDSYHGKRVIVAMGGKSYPKTGSNGDGYYYLEKFGHHIETPLPSLTPFICKDYDSSLFGVRQMGCIHLLIDGCEVNQARGEIQFTKTGISGICGFQMSLYASRPLTEGQDVRLRLSILDDITLDYLLDISKNQGSHTTITDAYLGILNRKLLVYILNKVGINPEAMAKEIRKEDINRFYQMLSNLEFQVTELGDFSQAQSTCGGVLLSEIDPMTMESKIVPGLYFAGEIVNVNGLCGGYNLQWAWTSAYLSGSNNKYKG